MRKTKRRRLLIGSLTTTVQKIRVSIRFKPLTVITGRNTGDGSHISPSDSVFLELMEHPHVRKSFSIPETRESPVTPKGCFIQAPAVVGPGLIIDQDQSHKGLDPWNVRRRWEDLVAESRKRQVIVFTVNPFLLDFVPPENLFVVDHQHSCWALQIPEVRRYRGTVKCGAMFLEEFFHRERFGRTQRIRPT